MLDVQSSVADYYSRTAGFGVEADALATPVRACASFVQVLNERLRGLSNGQADYRSMFETPEDPRVGIILAFKYARDVSQHVPHPVRPVPSALFGGGFGLGDRTYAIWEDIPMSAHGRLKHVTQQLKPHFDRHLRGRAVTDTLLEAASFLAEVCPDIVHRQPNGEWTHFPLSHQAGVSSRLHPEEPVDHAAALAWMNSRRPGGDLRVLCGSLGGPDASVLFGLTFRGRCAFTPFFETADQVSADLALGFEYYEGDIGSNTHEGGAQFGCTDGRRSVLCSKLPIADWAGEPVAAVPEYAEHTAFASVDFWRDIWALESAPNGQAFITRRERRLNASVPHR